MAKRLRTIYRWPGTPGEGALERVGEISEARLRAWEYRIVAGSPWDFAAGAFHDTVREWQTSRPDLRIPECLWVGDREESVEA